MKLKLILTGLMMITGLMTMHSAKNKYADKPLDSIKWRWICEGRMGDAWYGPEDAEPMVDAKGVEVVTSLNPYRRIKYQFLGDWPQEVIEKDYPKWKQRIEKKKI